MELILKKQIGKNQYNFVFQGKDFHSVIMDSENLSFPDIPKCGLCGDDNLYLHAYITNKGGYKYVKVVCRACRASITFGRQKENSDQYYLRKTGDGKLDWQKFEAQDGKPKEQGERYSLGAREQQGISQETESKMSSEIW